MGITTITTTARVLKNNITIEVGKIEWVAKPLPMGHGPIAQAISTLFSTYYTVYESAEKEAKQIANVSYYPVKDEILIQVEEQKWKTESNTFGPSKIVFEDIEYVIHEKITGKFVIMQGEEIVAEGVCRFRSVVISSYPKKLETFLAYLSVGLLIRTLFGEMGV
jgi:hypothetical protein